MFIFVSKSKRFSSYTEVFSQSTAHPFINKNCPSVSHILLWDFWTSKSWLLVSLVNKNPSPQPESSCKATCGSLFQINGLNNFRIQASEKNSSVKCTVLATTSTENVIYLPNCENHLVFLSENNLQNLLEKKHIPWCISQRVDGFYKQHQYIWRCFSVFNRWKKAERRLKLITKKTCQL